MRNTFSLKSTTALGAAIAAIVSVSAGCSSSSPSQPSTSDVCHQIYASFSSYYQACDSIDSAIGDENRFVQSCLFDLNAPGVTATSKYEQCAGAADSAKATCGSVDDSACSNLTGTLATGSACGEGMQCQSGFCKTSNPYTTGCGVCADRTPIGQPCTVLDQCVVGAACVLGPTGSTGTCTPTTKVDVGGSCSQAGTICKDGLTCDGATTTCVALHAEGGACTSRYDCHAPLACIGGACAQGKAAGQACLAGQCAPGLGCDLQSQTCKARVAVDPGKACDYEVNYCRVGYCQASGTATNGVCPPVIPDGQPCDFMSTSSVCDSNAQCVDGKCTLFDPSTCK
jgi:hypothetical protein